MTPAPSPPPEDLLRRALATATAELRASEARFRQLSDSAPIGIFESNAPGRCTYVNPALLDIVQRTETEVLGFGWARTIHPADRSLVHENWLGAATTGRKWRGEVRLVLPDGGVRWVTALAAPNKDASGAVTGFVGTIEDITEKRIAEIALLESEDRYRKLLWHSPDGHFVHVDGRFTYANPALCRMLGAPAAEALLGSAVLGIVPRELHAVVRERLAHVVAGGHMLPVEMDFLRLDGTRVPVELAAVSFDLRGQKEVLVTVRNISARRAAETALRENEQRFQLVARAVSDVIWDWDLPAQTMWWSEGFQVAFGYPAAEVGSDVASWTDRIHDADRERIVADVGRAIAGTDSAWSGEYRFRRKDGSYAVVHDRGQIMRDPTGLAYRIVGGMSDHTERKNLEARFLRAQRMESIGTLAGGIAHDLNNVLAPIMMSIDLLKQDLADRPEQLLLLETLHGSAKRGADLVRQVLSFARGVEGERMAVNIRHVLDDLEGLIRETLPRNIGIAISAPRNLWPLVGDATQLHQVFLNLAVNARDAMPHGGTLAFKAENALVNPDPRAEPMPHVRVTVSDTGTGIPPEIRDRIFEPFFTTKQLGKGTGLGLATVHAVVTSHGGSVDVESELGRGTTFIIRVPADPTVSSGSRSPLPVSLTRGDGEVVLVVDDEEPIRTVTQRTLEAFGYRVLVAANGAEGLEVFGRHAHEIRLVLTDMMMPVMDGATMIRHLLERSPGVLIVASSGLHAKEDLEKATGTGIAHFLAKPYTTQSMLQLFRRLLDGHAAPV